MSEIPYPLPPELVDTAEHLLSDVPDRGDTVYLLRRYFGKVYALGYRDGYRVAEREGLSDRVYDDAHRCEAVPPEGISRS